MTGHLLYTEEDVELVARALPIDHEDGTTVVEILPWKEGQHSRLIWGDPQRVARAVLAALSSANRLVPPGSEVREEWGVWHQPPGHGVTVCVLGPDAECDDEEAWARGHAATEPGSHIERRLHIVTPWSPVMLPTGTDEPIPRAETSAEAANPSVPDTEEGS